MELSAAKVILLLVVISVAITLAVGVFNRFLEARERRRTKVALRHPTWDPALCPHLWELCESGTCTKNPSGWEGHDRPRWKVEVCARCATKRFTCDYRKCANYAECRLEYEKDNPEPGTLESELIDRVADAHGFEYSHYRLRDHYGNMREGWCRIVPTTIAFACPDCGGMVVGVGASRVWPGTKGSDPESYRCEQCGRQEDHEFGEPRVTSREGNPTFVEPRGVQPVCPRGGKHDWAVLDEWSELDFPEGVDSCIENLHLVEEVWHQRLICRKCGETKTV